MALVEIKALPQKSGIKTSLVLIKLCRELGAALGRLPSGFKAVFQTLPPEHYVHDEKVVKVQPPSSHPPLVTFFTMEGMSDREKETVMRVTSLVLAKEFSLAANNIHIIFRETEMGHLYSDGSIQYQLT